MGIFRGIAVGRTAFPTEGGFQYFMEVDGLPLACAVGKSDMQFIFPNYRLLEREGVVVDRC
jgi:hypothetical protein